MKSYRISCILFSALLVFLLACGSLSSAEEVEIFTPLSTILQEPQRFLQDFVTVKATFRGWRNAPGAPPVTRSDWVIQGTDGATLYVTGMMPDNLRPDDPTAQGKQITILGQVRSGPDGRPYLLAHSVRQVLPQIEPMVAVSQVLFNPLQMKGKFVGLHGVLTKGFDAKGRRLYLIADPTGALLLEKLPKLYPTGTILRLRGYVGADENGLPRLENIDIVSARP